MEAREQSSDPKPKKNSKLEGHGKKKGCLGGRGGGNEGGYTSFIQWMKSVTCANGKQRFSNLGVLED
jgi:hypothetical protein